MSSAALPSSSGSREAFPFGPFENSPGAVGAAQVRIPDHQLIQPIGKGSYGEVWLAKNVVGTLRAIKIVFRNQFSEAEPYEREFKGMQRFEPLSRSHEGFVDILQIGHNEEEGYFYYVMELADNAAVAPGAYEPKTLRSELKNRGSFPVSEAVSIGLALSSALEHLHKSGLVHRDIKPSNIIFVGGIPKLADIGLIVEVDEAKTFVGTTGYIPPEGPGTPQADLYSLGKVLYEISTGKDRRQFPQLPATLKTQEDAAELVEFNEVLIRACEADLNRRYKNALELRRDLELLQTGKSVRDQRASEWRWRVAKRCAITLVVAGILFSLFGAIAARLLRSREDTELHSLNSATEALVAQGNLALTSMIPGQLDEAFKFFSKAVEADPSFVPAYFGIFRARLHQWGQGFTRPPADVLFNVRVAATNLIRMAPNLAEGRLAKAWLDYMDGDLAGALAEARQAAQMRSASKSGIGFVHVLYGWFLQQALDPESALEELLLAEKEIPQDPLTQAHLGHAYAQLHNFPKALEHYQTSINCQPWQSSAYEFRGGLFEEQGKILEALEDFKMWRRYKGYDEEKTKAWCNELRDAFTQGGLDGYWRARLDQCSKSSQDAPGVAQCLFHLGRIAEAYERLERSDNQELERYLPWDICFDRSDPRFSSLLRKLRQKYRHSAK